MNGHLKHNLQCYSKYIALVHKKSFFLSHYTEPIEVPITLPPSEYIGKVQDQLMVNISAFVTVKETDSVFVDKETFRFKTPDIHIRPDKKILYPGQQSRVRASFMNPLNVTLRNVEWFVEGSELTTPLVIPGQ